jgi:CRP-like cAMP-binding protein
MNVMEFEPGDPLKHRLLANLNQDDRQQLSQYLEKVFVLPREVIYWPSRPIDTIYFPLSAVFSLVGTTREGDTVEIGQIGDEGIVGVAATLRGLQSDEHSTTKTAVQVPGTALRMKAKLFDEEMDRNRSLNRCVRRYLGVLYDQLILAVTCNRHHSLEQRCARWLLAAQDRSQADEVPMTQEHLADMLGVRRQSAEQTLAALRDKGMIVTSRGILAIENRKALESVACDCYHIIKRRLDTFLA